MHLQNILSLFNCILFEYVFFLSKILPNVSVKLMTSCEFSIPFIFELLLRFK